MSKASKAKAKVTRRHAVFTPEESERHRQIDRTGEKEVRAICEELFGRSSFIEDEEGPTAEMMCALNNERVRRQSCGRALQGLAMVAKEIVGQLPTHTPEGERFAGSTRAFIEAARWYEWEELAVIEASHDVLWEGVLKGKRKRKKGGQS